MSFDFSFLQLVLLLPVTEAGLKEETGSAEETGDLVSVSEGSATGESTTTASVSKVAAGKVHKKAKQIVDQAQVAPGGKIGIKHKPMSHIVSRK